MRLGRFAPFGWALWIFATSCTVVSRDAFIRAIERVLPGSARHLWSESWLRFGLVFVKAYHVGEFAVLCALLFSALRAAKRTLSQALFWSAACCLAFAVTDEWHQTFVPGRGGTWVDVCIDALGVGLACGFIGWRAARSQRRLDNAATSS